MSGPLLDRIDLYVDMPPVPVSPVSALGSAAPAGPAGRAEGDSAAARERVAGARRRQQARYAGVGRGHVSEALQYRPQALASGSRP